MEGRGHEFETRHPLHFGCVHALRGHAVMVLVARDVRDPRPEPRAARHHIRRDARVWAQPKWIHAFVAQQAEQPPCKRQAARSNRRRRHHQPCRVRLAGPGHRDFSPVTRVRSTRAARWTRRRRGPKAEGAARAIPHAMPGQPGAPSSSRFGGGNRPQRLGGAGTRHRMDHVGV